MQPEWLLPAGPMTRKKAVHLQNQTQFLWVSTWVSKRAFFDQTAVEEKSWTGNNNHVLITEPFGGILKFYMSRSVI